MTVRNKTILAAFLLILSSALYSLEMRDGRILLSIDEKTARFTIHYLADAARNRYVALLYDQEPRTSFPTLSWNGKNYRLGESTDFRFTVKQEASQCVIEYRSSFALVRQVFRFIGSKGSPETDGLFLEYSIENLSGSAAKIGLRLVWDTYLGERSKKHFELDGTGFVNVETLLTGSAVPSRAISPGDMGTDLQIQLAGEGISRPDKMLLANWKRINDTGWSFESSAGRNFTLLPYSIDDSAAAVFYEPVEIRDGSSRTIRTILGNRSDAGYSTNVPLPEGSPAEAAIAISSPQKETELLSAKTDPFVTARTDIAALREIIARIDEYLAAGKEPSEKQLAELRDLITLIRSRGKDL